MKQESFSPPESQEGLKLQIATQPHRTPSASPESQEGLKPQQRIVAHGGVTMRHPESQEGLKHILTQLIVVV